MLSVVDLFAGAGGLSLGFMQAGNYDIKVAFENNPCMQDTYRRNHTGVEVLGDVCKANYREIMEKYGGIDVVIGGPPCQGFSNANRQKNHAVNQNNMLVKQYIRAVRELQPKAFIMENVSMLCSDTHRFFYNEYDVEDVRKYKIKMVLTKLTLLEKDFMFPEAKAIVMDWDTVQAELWADKFYCALNVVFKASNKGEKTKNALAKHRRQIEDGIIVEEKRNSGCRYIHEQSKKAFDSIRAYYAGKTDEASVKKDIECAIMIQRMLNKAKEIHDNKIIVKSYVDDCDLVANIKTYGVFDYLQSILKSGPDGYKIDAKVLCAADYGAPQKRERFVVMGVKKSLSKKAELPRGDFEENKYRTVCEAIKDLETINPVINLKDDVGIKLPTMRKMSDLGKQLRDSNRLYNHIITNTGKNAMDRFKALKQGENFHSLDESLKTNTYKDSSRTQNTIYLRLDYDSPCGTVVNVRKSMWVHPTLDRAISVREAARLQTFPDSFVFCGTKDKQYQQVGNAVPPVLARAIALKLNEILG